MDAPTALSVIPLFAGLTGVSAAAFTSAGRLLAVEGFLAGLLPGDRIAASFASPTWEQLAALAASAGGGPAHDGEIRLEPGAQVLQARLWHAHGTWLLVAQLPVDDVEPLSRAT